MRANELALSRGLRDTRSAWARWSRDGWRVLRSWGLLSLAIAIALLLAIYAVASLAKPDPTPLLVAGLDRPPTLHAVGAILFRNSLVLALHAFACVAGFIAGSSLPLAAEQYSGIWRTVHERAGPLAILFVIGATGFSLMTQAFVLGSNAATIAASLGLSPAYLLAIVSLHAIPELTALFLPLAAWIIASRRDDWQDLLAATFVTVAVAVPVLVVTAVHEVYVTPLLLRMAVGA